MSVAVRWASEETVNALAMLTSQQATGVIRIVEAELEGRTLTSLLEGPDRICAFATYYGRGKNDTGWKDKPEFQEALTLARRDYRKFLLENSTGETLLILSSTAPDAARALRQQIVGDAGAIAALEAALTSDDSGLRAEAARQLGETGLGAVVPALQDALADEEVTEVREALALALGRIAGFRDGDRRAAVGSVLSRVSEKTAEKGVSVMQGDPDNPVQYVDVTEGELDAIRGALISQAETEGGGET